LEPHDLNFGRLSLKIDADGHGGYILTGIDLGADSEFSLTKLHGWLFWVGWGFFGFI